MNPFFTTETRRARRYTEEISVSLRVLRVSVVKKVVAAICLVLPFFCFLLEGADKIRHAGATAKPVPAELILLPGSA